MDGGADNEGHGLNYGYAASRGELGLTSSGARLILSTTFSYWVRARQREQILFAHPLIDGSCGTNGESLRTAAAVLPLDLSVDSSWAILAHSVGAQLTPGNRCKMTIKDYDATDVILNQFRGIIAGQSAALNDRIRSTTDLRAPLQLAWTLLSVPSALGPRVWFVPHPQHVALSLRGTSNALTAVFQFIAQPTIERTSRPAVTALPVPAPSAPSPTDGFSIVMPIDGKYCAFSDAVSRSLNFETKPLTLTDAGQFYRARPIVNVYGYGSTVVVRVDLDERVPGTLYLRGTPSLDPATRALVFPDLEYTDETKQVLEKYPEWGGATTLRDTLRSRLRIDLSDKIDRLKDQITRSLTRQIGAAKIVATFPSARAVSLYASPSGNRANTYVAFDGTLFLSLN